ncbi:MAG: alpha/beta fold hydrolase [Chloroflexota bacterium]|jgi:pimeloyl-ACP methyl ester carboxylesterase
MMSRFKGLGLTRIALAVIAVCLILLAWWGILNTQCGLTIRSLMGEGDVPLLYMVPDNAGNVPGVLIAHGFAGSKQLMYGYGTVLARAGYGVMLLDFDGHGAASGRLDRQGDGLRRNLNSAYTSLLAQPEIDPNRIALLGHSMGSGAVMQAAVDQADRYRAVIAVSPTGAEVSPQLPRNFLLQAGALEPRFAANARELLAAAGGENADLTGGLARKLVIVPNVEHITILFSRESHQSVLDWFNETFGLPLAPAAPDRRMLWYGLHLAGWLILIMAVNPLFPKTAPLPPSARRSPWYWLGLLLGGLAAVGSVALLGRMLDVGSLGGLLVGGALGVWFLVMGLIWLLGGFRPPRPNGGDLFWGLVLFLILTLAFGVMAQLVWLPWWLNGVRLARWPLLAAAALPWLLAAGLAQHNTTVGRRAGWWLLQTCVIIAGLGLTVAFSPGLFFVVLLLPVIPIILAIMTIFGAAIDRPWSFAVGNTLFFGWLLVAVFPLS